MKEEVKNGIIISVTVILILIVVYLTTAVFMTGELGKAKSNGNKTTTTTTTFASSMYKNNIIASMVFKQPESEYMVMMFSQSKVSDGLKNSLTSYDSGSKDIKLYKVNLDEVVNKYVLGEEENALATSGSELRTKDMVLIRIKNGVISSYVTNENEIIKELK